MRTIRQLLEHKKKIYFYFENNALCYRFLSDAQLEGFTFCDGSQPCTKPSTDLIALQQDELLYWVRWAGHIVYKQGGDSVLRIDYGKYIREEEEYIIRF